MKKFWVVLLSVAVVALALFVYFRFYFVFGEGVKSGELNYVVYKGVLFKTYEGKLIQSGIRSKTAGSIQSYEFEFSVDDEELARRKAAYVQPEPNVKSGWLSRYARMVTSANFGAVLQ